MYWGAGSLLDAKQYYACSTPRIANFILWAAEPYLDVPLPIQPIITAHPLLPVSYPVSQPAVSKNM